MATLTLTQDNLQSLIDDSDMLIIDFWAEWCGPCRAFAPTFEAASEKHPNVVFAKCDTEAEQQVAGMFKVQSIPMIVVFREGVGIFRKAGALPPTGIDELLGQVAALDMDQVRKTMATPQQADA